jgi:hypothetical protein
LQQVEVYHKLNFHKLGSPTVAGTITCTAVAPSLQFGTPTYTAAGCADGAGVPLSTNYAVASSNRFSAFEIVADTGSTDLTGDTYQAAIHGKLNIGTTQSNASLMAGLFSLDVADDKNFTGGNYFALRGHLDFWDDSTFSGTTHVGALSAYVENESTTTIGAGTYLYGLDVYQVGAPTNSGTNPAINIRASSTASKWQYGIYMNPLQIGCAMKVGTAYETSGSVIDGYGMSLATGYAGGSSNRLYGVDITTDTGSTDLTGDTMVGGIRGRTVIGTTQTNASIYGVHGNLDVGASKNLTSGNFAAVYGVVDFYGDSTFAGAVPHVAGGLFTIWNEGTTTVNAAGGSLAGVNIYQVGSPTVTAGINPAVYIRASATASNWQYGIYGNADNGINLTCVNDGIRVTSTTLNATAGRIGYYAGSIATGNLGDGYGAFEIDVTATGTIAGFIAPLSSWLNITGTGAAGANIVCAQSNGIYADSGGNTGSIVIFGMRASGILTDAPTVFAPFSINTSNRAITALFEMNSNPDVGYLANANTSGAKVGDVPLFCDAAGQQYFVRIYNARG